MLTEDRYFRDLNEREVRQRYCGFFDLSAGGFKGMQKNLLLDKIERVGDSLAGKKMMSNAKPPKGITQNTHTWESELWHYLDSGDGVKCPLHDNCEVRERGGWCFDDHAEEISRAYGNVVDISNEEAISLSDGFVKHLFPDNWVPGRIFQLVEMLADKYLAETRTTCPPVPTKLIKELDLNPPLEIRRVPLKAYHGAVWRLENCWIIHLNANDSIYRQRLTLFHEAFHILAHSKATPVFRKRGFGEGFFNEMLADYFAGCVLMPEEWVKEKWAEVHDLKQMAKIFRVSELALWIRLRAVGLI